MNNEFMHLFIDDINKNSKKKNSKKKKIHKKEFDSNNNITIFITKDEVQTIKNLLNLIDKIVINSN